MCVRAPSERKAVRWKKVEGVGVFGDLSTVDGYNWTVVPEPCARDLAHAEKTPIALANNLSPSSMNGSSCKRNPMCTGGA